MKSEIRIIIADDHPIVRKGLRQIIELESNLLIIGEAGNGAEALRLIEELKPDVAILDVDMPHQDGFQVAQSVFTKKIPVELVFLTVHKEEELFQAAMDLGVRAYVLKESVTEDIVTAIHEVYEHRIFTSLPITNHFVVRNNRNPMQDEVQSRLQQLTATEYRILKLLSEYKTNKEIANELFISPRTVETHRVRICQKLDLKGAHALMKFAVQYKSLL